tara:strand:- start:906 stop:1373 length:468 start_codon:yes stop_codon:yes gene_type:complete
MKLLITALAISGLAFTVGTQSLAQDYGSSITSEQAKVAAAAAIESMNEHGWKMALSIVDTGGHLVHFEKIDGTQFASIRISMAKAKAAVGFRRPTRAFAQGIVNNPALVTLPGVVGSPGGVPIVVNGQIIGALGCSGDTGDNDEIACDAGAAALQ